jgi:pimeloyl-ACP methyl ester carboxylesterase
VLAKQPKLYNADVMDYQPQPGTMEDTLGYQIGSHAPDYAPSQALRPVGQFLTSLGTDTPAATLMGGALGGAVGAGTALLRGRGLVRSMLLGALAGGGGSYGLSRVLAAREQRRAEEGARYGQALAKRSFYAMAEDGESAALSLVQARLFQDPAVPPAQKAALLTAVQQMPPEQVRALSELVRSAMGASIGYLVARFLTQWGAGGRAAAALAGGFLGWRLGGNPSNVYGQRVDTQRDVFGNRRLLF